MVPASFNIIANSENFLIASMHDYVVVGVDKYCQYSKGPSCRFDDSPKICRLAAPVPETLDR